MTQSLAPSSSSVANPAPPLEQTKSRYFCFDTTKAFINEMVACEWSCSAVAAKIFCLALPIIAALETVFELFRAPFVFFNNCCREDEATEVKVKTEEPEAATIAPRDIILLGGPGSHAILKTEAMINAEIVQKFIANRDAAEKAPKITVKDRILNIFKREEKKPCPYEGFGPGREAPPAATVAATSATVVS